VVTKNVFFSPKKGKIIFIILCSLSLAILSLYLIWPKNIPTIIPLPIFLCLPITTYILICVVFVSFVKPLWLPSSLLLHPSLSQKHIHTQLLLLETHCILHQTKLLNTLHNWKQNLPWQFFNQQHHRQIRSPCILWFTCLCFLSNYTFFAFASSFSPFSKWCWSSCNLELVGGNFSCTIQILIYRIRSYCSTNMNSTWQK
jgi:hypothetical protein